MSNTDHLWDSGERVPAEPHNTLYLELLSAYKFANGLIRSGTVLDVGAGAGYGADCLAGAGRQVLAIDYEARVITAAAGRYRRHGLWFACMDGMHLGVRSGSVDLACAFQVIEHLKDPERFVGELARVLSGSGVAVLSTPNALTHVGPGNPFHAHEFMPEELRALLGRHFSYVMMGGQRRPPEVYALESACRRVRLWDVFGIKKLVPRGLISLAVYAVAKWNRLPPPQRMPLSMFPISQQTESAYSLFALCSHAPFSGKGLAVGADL